MSTNLRFKKNGNHLLYCLFVVVIIYLVFLRTAYAINGVSNFKQEIYPITECNDGIDNDGDGGIDFASDAQCTSWIDTSEFPDPDPPPPPQDNNNNGNVIPPTIIDTGVEEKPEENETDGGNGVGEIIQTFVYQPLGSVLGIENSDFENMSTLETASYLGILFIIYFVLCLFIFFLVKRRKEDEEEHEDF